MKQLDLDWITSGLMDTEYKQWILLAYLQHVNKEFGNTRLFPYLSDLITHYQNLLSIKKNKEAVSEQFPKSLTNVDLKHFKLHYEKLDTDADYIEVIEEVLAYAIPRLQEHIEDGKSIYDYVEDHMDIYPVGVVPLNLENGYLFLRSGRQKDTQVYEYEITIFENVSENYRGIKTSYLTSYTKNFSNTYQSLKVDLIKTHKKYAHPATYVVECDMEFPLYETFLPIAKRSLVRFIADQESQ